MLAMSKKDQAITNYKKMSIEQLEDKLRSANADEMNILLNEITLRHKRAITWWMGVLFAFLVVSYIVWFAN